MEKDEFFIKRIRELANLSYQRDIVTFSDFLNLNEQNIINDRKNQMPGVVMECFGGYEQAERQMVAFHPDALLFPWKYPIKCLKAEPLAAKFSEDLTHRDFLGAVLNLGIERAVVGDILVQKHTAWIFCHEKIADYIIENLTRVRHTTMKLSMVDNPEHIPEPEFQEINGTCASVRLDALIGLAFQTSRNSMVPFIEGGQVFVNGKLITSNGYEPKDGDIISVDVGACYKGYHGDSAWTYAVGNVSNETKRLMNVCEGALFAGLEQVKPGVRLSDISHAIEEYLTKNGCTTPRDYTGHGIGTNVHEDPAVPNYGAPGRGPRLKKGMCLAIEPMAHLGAKETVTLDDGWTVITKDHSLAAHYEHTIVITDDGYRILTKL